MKIRVEKEEFDNRKCELQGKKKQGQNNGERDGKKTSGVERGGGRRARYQGGWLKGSKTELVQPD